jgi:hypothetical protein
MTHGKRKTSWVLQTRRFTILLAGLILIFALPLRADDVANRFSIAWETGNWQPHSLNDQPDFKTFGKAGATPFFGVILSLPFGKEYGLQASVSYWSLRDLNEVENVHSLTVHPLLINLKYWLVPDYRLSAYVTYGGGLYWGIENETSPFGDRLRKARAGLGANLGAGFDLAISRRLGLGMSFQYHYIRFKEPLGGVNDFSGPKLAVMVFYYL